MDILGFINSQEPVVGWTTAKKQGMLNSLAENFGYYNLIAGDADPPTKQEYVNEIIIKHIKGWVNGHRKKESEQAATYTKLEW